VTNSGKYRIFTARMTVDQPQPTEFQYGDEKGTAHAYRVVDVIRTTANETGGRNAYYVTVLAEMIV